jgi:phage/plasmid-like protein (TIGR03299 family)
MAHEIETMAFANEVPWHGLGQRVDPNVSIEEMLVAAGLDWEVELRPMYAEAPNGEMIRLPIRRALMRTSDNKVMTITGDMWKPLQNRDAMEFFREYTEMGGARLETAGSLRGGKVIWALASINEGFTINGRDHVKGYILLTSPHEVGRAITVRTTTVRVVCANTMAMALRSEADYSQNHLSVFNAAKAKETIGLAREQIHQAYLDATALDKLKMSEYDTVRFLAKFFAPTPEGQKEQEHIELLLNDQSHRTKQLDQVLRSVHDAPGATPGTAWGVLNGVTHWADHVAGYNNEARLWSTWMGDRAKLKLQVRDELLEAA